jgi:DNA adenine methylase
MLSESPVESTAVPAPTLRWAGGKRWLLSRLRKIVTDFGLTNYHEPFLGAAAVFVDLQAGGVARLSDLNAELIEVYREARDAPTAVADAVTTQENTCEHYYNARASCPSTEPERPARFIYLNHTLFNGLRRVLFTNLETPHA